MLAEKSVEIIMFPYGDPLMEVLKLELSRPELSSCIKCVRPLTLPYQVFI